MDQLILIIGSVSTACLVLLAVVSLAWKFAHRNQDELKALRVSVDEIKSVLFEINERLGRVEGRLERVEGRLDSIEGQPGYNPFTGGVKDSDC